MITVAFYDIQDTFDDDAIPNSIFTGTADEINEHAQNTGQCYEVIDIAINGITMPYDQDLED